MKRRTLVFGAMAWITIISVTLKDSGGTLNGGVDTSETATFTVTVDPINDPPVAADDAENTDEDTAVTIDVLANDDDLDAGDTLFISGVGSPGSGTATGVVLEVI